MTDKQRDETKPDDRDNPELPVFVTEDEQQQDDGLPRPVLHRSGMGGG